MEALRMEIKNHQSTRVHGNVLDLIICEGYSTIKVIDTRTGPFLSDHCAVESLINLPKADISRKEVESRKLDNIDIESFMSDVSINVGDLNGLDLDEQITLLDNHLSSILDKHAPLTKSQVTVRVPNPWFSSKIKDQKKVVRRQEKIWRRYKEDHQLKAFNIERRRYRFILQDERKKIVSDNILEIGKDSKALYKFMRNMTGTERDNPMPTEGEDLADEFADFFMEKIKKIRDALDQYDKYIPTTNKKLEVFARFKPLSESDVERTIMSLASKSCELDVILTHLLKRILPSVIKVITHIINTSREQGVFADKWKMAIVRPLLKKIGLDPIDKNYRPVSNLAFLLKVLEKCV